MHPSRLSIITIGLTLSMLAGVIGCTRHEIEVQPIRVEPIHLTIDVNVRVDRELDDFFDYKAPPVPAPNGAAPVEAPGTVSPQGAASPGSISGATS